MGTKQRLKHKVGRQESHNEKQSRKRKVPGEAHRAAKIKLPMKKFLDSPLRTPNKSSDLVQETRVWSLYHRGSLGRRKMLRRAAGISRARAFQLSRGKRVIPRERESALINQCATDAGNQDGARLLDHSAPSET